MKTPTASPLEIVQSMYAAFGRGDIPTLLGGLHPKVTWGVNVDAGAPGAAAVGLLRPCSGPAQVAEFFAHLARDLEFHAFEPRTFFVNGREVIAHVVTDVTVKATQRRVREDTLHRFTFDEEGRLIQFKEYADTLGFAAAFGTVKAA